MKQSVVKKPVPGQSSIAPKPAKIMHETIQISLIRSITSPETSGGDKTSTTTAATSGSKSSNQSESKESVKDSDTSYSSSDTDPVSLSENEGYESSVVGEEDSEYSDEYSETEPTEPTSYGTTSSCTQHHTHTDTHTHSRSTGGTGSSLSEMPQTRRPTRSRALSIKSTPKSCDIPIKNITKHYSDYTSFGTTLTTNSGFYIGHTNSPNQNTTTNSRNQNSSSQNQKSSSRNRYTSSSRNQNTSTSRNQSNTPTSSQQPEGYSIKTATTPSMQFTKVLEPINENDYIRAKLTLPTNEVISILMKKDQKFMESILTTTPTQGGRTMNETGDSNDQTTLWMQQCHTDQGQGRSMSRHKTSRQQLLVDEYDKEKFRNRLANSPHPSNNVNKEESHFDKQMIDSQNLTKTSHMNKSSHVKGYKVREYRIPLRSHHTLGLEDFKDLENQIEEKPRPYLNMVKSKSEDRCKIPEPVSFSLPSLPKLTTEKSVSFKINTEIIRDRKQYGRCNIPFYKRYRENKLNDRRANKKERESHRLHKVSSTRCPKFIRFDLTDTPPEILDRSKQSQIKMLSRHSICDVGKSLLCKISKSPKVRSNEPVHAHERNVPCSCKTTRKAAIVDPRERSNSSTPDSFQTLSRVCERRLSCKKSVNTVTGNMNRKVDPSYQMMNENDIQRQIHRVLSAKLSLGGLPQLHKNRETFSRQRKPAKQQKTVKDKQTVSDKINRHNNKYETISPQGITKNYVRFYESNFLPEPDSTKYNFQIIRNKFESRENSRQKPEKRTLVNKMPFNFDKLCKQFSSKSKLNKCEYQVEEPAKDLSKGDSKQIRKESTEMKNSAKETFNNLLKEIIETVEKKKSERRIMMGRNNPKSDKETERNRKPKHVTKKIDSNRTDDSKSDLCTVWKYNDNNTPELKQLQIILKAVKRAYNKNMKNKKKKIVHLQAKQDLSKDVHSSRIGKHLVQMYLKCFSKREQTPYSQNDFINIRKVVDFFLKYLAFEYKYIRMYTNIDMNNIVYSVYAKISQRHYRLKNNFSTSSESDPQHDPWPLIVYDQLTQFCVTTDSNANCKESTTKLRPSLSLKSEHFSKYMAVDYFLKLLKIIIAAGKESEVTKENISCGTTTSTFNSHLYCELPSSSKTSSACFPNSPHAEKEPRKTASHITLRRDPTQTDHESLDKATRVHSIKAKLKRFKKRKTRRCLIQKQLNRSLNTKLNRLKQDTDLSKFELNRFVLNKTVNGKHLRPYWNLYSKNKLKYEVPNSRYKKIWNGDVPKGNSKEKQNKDDSTKLPDKNLEKTYNENKSVIVGRSTFQQPRQYNSQPPPPPPPLPQISKEEIIENNNASKLINEVSNLVGKIAKYNKNVNVEKIKQQINFLLESNSSELDGTCKEEVVEENKKQESSGGNIESENKTVMKHVQPSKNVQKTYQSESTSINLSCIQTSLIEEMKQNIQGVKTQTNNEHKNDSDDSPVDRSSVFKDLKHREAMVPVNMVRTLVRDNSQRGRDNENHSIEKTDRDCYREQSELLRNQQLFNAGTRNKVISNKINQKIMELTKNMSIDITKTLQARSKSPEKSTRFPEMNLEPCHMKATKNQEKKYAPTLSDLEESIKSTDKKCSPTETATKPSNAPPTRGNFISNDDLFFTNRRRPSVINRPAVLSVLELESNLLSDVKDSDGEFSIHEIYFKTPYYRHDSKSCTNQLENDIVVCDFQQDDVKPKQCSTINTREKCLTKKQMEVFNKLRTMYQEELDQASNVTTNKTSMVNSSEHNSILKADKRFDTTYRRPMCKRSKSHSYIYGYENEQSNISMKTCRSSETVPENTYKDHQTNL